jgi:hypothetical protein
MTNPSVSSQIQGVRESGNDSFIDPARRHFFTTDFTDCTDFLNETVGAGTKEKEEILRDGDAAEKWEW